MNTLFPDPTDLVPFVPSRIVSGGQTGVDRGALDAAMELSIPHGGWCPAGRLAEDGRIPDRYQLVELRSRMYRDRTEQNVIDSDATLILYHHPMTGGTTLTKTCCRRHRKPILSVRIDGAADDEVVAEVRSWLARERPSSLNIAGPRESGAPGIHELSRRILLLCLQSPPTTEEPC